MKSPEKSCGMWRVVTLAVLAAMAGVWAEGAPLFTIGARDNRTDDLALGPKDYTKFAQDAVFIVGKSDPKTDWPYCQPGPDDPWGKSKLHTFSIVFGLSQAPEAPCHLIVDLAETHGWSPPRLGIAINGQEKLFTLPNGGGDASINGDLSGAKEHVIDYAIPPGLLVAGMNQIAITTKSGCWLLYDGIEFNAPSGVRLTRTKNVTSLQELASVPALVNKDGKLWQIVRAKVLHTGKPRTAMLSVDGAEARKLDLVAGSQTVEMLIPPASVKTTVKVDLQVTGKKPITRNVEVSPVRKWELYLLHHTHLDIGYTHVQSDVEKRQWDHMDKALELAKASENYPEGSRFKWLPEGLWAMDSYVKDPAKKAALIEAVNKGWAGLDALYGSELTALCRPEELVELTGCARRLSKELAHPIDTAMITDVPGYTWGLIPVLAQSGVKYFSVGPNRGHRIGTTLSVWGDKPFYWLSPSGKEKVLCWVAAEGYSWFHGAPLRDEKRIFEYLDRLDRSSFAYDVSYLRYNVGGDNGPPDPEIANVVRAWNEKYAYPKLIIATPHEFFSAFEKRYGTQLPEVRGDFTPYWEDGAASTARETAVNRDAAERLVRANALWAMLRDPKDYPAAQVQDAWRDIVLYDEHTWGAYNSISEPEADFVKQQWGIKAAFALEGARKATALEQAATGAKAEGSIDTVRVFNTLSFPRTDLLTIPADWKRAGDRVEDVSGKPVASQRLSTGELVFVAKDIAPFSAAVYRFTPGAAQGKGAVCAKDNRLTNGLVTVAIDPATGAVTSLQGNGVASELVDTTAEPGLGGYMYVAGRDPKNRSHSGAATVKLLENGPVMASYLVEAPAPGCRAFRREVRVIDGLPFAQIVAHLDRENVYAQEGVHLTFPFKVPQGVVRLDTPWAVTEVEKDMIPGSCKEYQTVQRWVDVSNADCGVTLASIDAPMLEIGEPTTGVRDDIGKRLNIAPSTLLYSYVMNNYWETNYKASQEGLTTFRYAVMPHKAGFDAAAAARFGMAQSTPLMPVPAKQGAKGIASALKVSPCSVVAEDLKPSDDGKAWILRLHNLSAKEETVRIDWHEKKAKLFQSNLGETCEQPLIEGMKVPAQGMATVRIEEGNAK